jgi:hypothetical protein
VGWVSDGRGCGASCSASPSRAGCAECAGDSFANKVQVPYCLALAQNKGRIHDADSDAPPVLYERRG